MSATGTRSGSGLGPGLGPRLGIVETARLEAVTEQLYALLPPHLRVVDARNGWALKAFMEVLARGSSEIDQEIDRLYASQFVETAPQEALADFAALIAAEPLRPLPEGAGRNMRAYIANTIRYRRGKGTARVLEALATDVGGEAAIAVEYFQRLARLQNLLDVRPERPATARLSSGETGALVGSAHDGLPRLAQVRGMARGGRHHTTYVGLHLVRLQVPFYAGPIEMDGIAASQLDGVPVARPWQQGAAVLPGYFQLAAINGRPLRLFNPDRRSQDDRARPVVTDMPDRLRRLPLHRETEELRIAKAEGRAARLSPQPWFDALAKPFAIYARRTGEATFSRIAPETIRIARLEALPSPAGVRPAPTLTHRWGYDDTQDPPFRSAEMPISCGFDPATGRILFPEPLPQQGEVEEVRVAHGTGIGYAMGAGAQDRSAPDIPLDVSDEGGDRPFVCIVDGTIAAPAGIATQTTLRVATLKEALDAWAAAAQPAGTLPPLRGYIVLIRCDRFTANLLTVRVPTGSSLEIVSGQWVEQESGPDIPLAAARRGYILREARRFTVDALVRVQSIAIAQRPTPGTLRCDGIEFTRGIDLGQNALSDLRLRHCTVRRPGDIALSAAAPPFELTLRAERCILGRIAPADGGESASCRIELSESIVSADEATGPAIDLPHFTARFNNVTVLGMTRIRQIDATNAIFMGALAAARTQVGCLRFSHVPPGPDLPQRFRCQPELALAAAREAKGAALSDDEQEIVLFGARPRLLDTALDEPTVALLDIACSDAIRHGGEGDTEMGAFARSAQSLRLHNVTRFFDDYLPFGLAAALIDDTRSARVAARRNKP